MQIISAVCEDYAFCAWSRLPWEVALWLRCEVALCGCAVVALWLRCGCAVVLGVKVPEAPGWADPGGGLGVESAPFTGLEGVLV